MGVVKDSLTRAIEAIEEKRRFLVPGARRDITLISYHHLTQEQAPAIRRLIVVLKKQLGFESRVVGGGYGCSTIEIEIAISDPIERQLALRGVLGCKEVREIARSAGCIRIVISEPYEGMSLITGELDGYLEASRRHGERQGGPTLITNQPGGVINMGNMGDNINAEKSMVATRGAEVSNVSQTWDSWVASGDCDFKELSKQLEELLPILKDRARDSDSFIELGAVAEAQKEAVKGNGQGVMSALRRTGKWVADIAKEVGVTLVVKALEKSATAV